MSQRPWYKRYPSDFLSGTYRLSAEQKGVYAVLLDLMYDGRKPIDDNPRELSRICGCSTRRFNQIKSELVAAEKIVIADGKISNPRFERQILTENNSHENLSKNGRKVAESTNEKRGAASDNNGLAVNRPVSVSPAITRYQSLDSKKDPIQEEEILGDDSPLVGGLSWPPFGGRLQ